MDKYQENNLKIINLSPKDQIDILLHEYDTLRDEIVENIARQQASLAIWTTIIIAILGVYYQIGDTGLLALLPVMLLLFLNMEAGRQYSILIKSTYIRIIEKRVNIIANSPILFWEQSGSGYFLYQLRVPHPNKKGDVFNTQVILLGFYPLLIFLLFFWSLLKGGEFLYINLSLSPIIKITTVLFYVLSHITILGFIFFSRFHQENKILAAYEYMLWKKIRDSQSKH